MQDVKFEISGTYEKTLFRDEKTGYTIFALHVKRGVENRNAFGTISCIGIIPIYTKGMPLIVSGKWKPNKYNGMTLHIDKISEYIDDREISISYLSTNLCKGIGKQTAEMIVDKYGADIFSFVQRSDAEECLMKIKGMTKEKTETLLYSIKNTIRQRQLFEYIAKFGGSYMSSIKIAEEYGYLAIQSLKSEPYKVGRYGGLSFAICDAIAKECGFTYLNHKRVEALIYEAMYSLTSSGNTYTKLKDIYIEVNKIVQNSAFHEKISSVIIVTYLTIMKNIVIERDINNDKKIYLKSLYYAEKNSLTELNRLNNSSPLPFNESVIEYAEKICNIKYSKSQEEAFNALKTTGVKIITGGPGTGKTTTIKGIIEAYKKLNPLSEVVLCAPTGRAAQRLKESTGHEAFTVHKLLEYKPFGRDVSHKDSSNPINADFIIVDEFSMIDIEIFSILLNAIKNNSLVFFVGDCDQLPSVGPGNVMSDLIKSKKIELYRLEAVFRQGHDSNIIINSQKIRNGETDLTTNAKDFEIIRVDNVSDMKMELKKIVNEYYTKNPFDVQILTSTKKNEVGTVELNEDLQEMLNDSSDKIIYGNLKFKRGDKIIMTQNNYEAGYYNGDMGIIKEIDEDGILLEIDEEEIFLKRKNFEDINLAYAITIHKSQGSEFPLVVITLPKYPYNMLQRNLIFTAITRAKEKVIIITEQDALETAIKKTDIVERKTSLLNRLLNVAVTVIPQRKKEILQLK